MEDEGLRSTAADLGQQYKELHKSELVSLSRPTAGNGLALVLPEGRTSESIKEYLDEFLEKPERRHGTATLVDVDSFIAHAKRFASASSAIFASPVRQSPSLTSVIDYYPESTDTKATDWLQHRGVYKLPLSDEWTVWLSNNNKLMQVADFAAFIESRVTDIVVPNLDDPKLKTFADIVQGKWAEPSDLLGLSRGLSINVDTEIKNHAVLQTGEITVAYAETHRESGSNAPIKIANLFQICIPVFYNGGLYRIAAWLRYRVLNGKINWMYQLVRPDLAFDDAFDGIVKQVREETKLPVLLGAPEQ